MKPYLIITLGLMAAALRAEETSVNTTNASAKTELATFAGGCFWCMEAVFEQMPGVSKVVSGYTGGRTKNPTYREICAHGTGHAEAIQITFDPAKTSYDELLHIFWQAHDPTQLNRQGNDVGDQYRSAIFYHNEAQKKAAEASKADAAKSGKYKDPIVTLVEPAVTFYPAEAYHQSYYRLNKDSNPYCRLVIQPKLKKMGLKD